MNISALQGSNGVAHREIVSEDILSILQAQLPWRELEGATILVTGAGGFLASYFVETLLAMQSKFGFGPRQIVGLVRNLDAAEQRFAAHRDRDELCLLKGDVTDSSVAWHSSLDFIVHAASPATPKTYLTNPAGVIDANLMGMRNMLALADRHKSRVLFVSSAEVYGQVETIPIAEADYGYLDLESVRSCYGEAKRAAEVMGVAWAHQFGIHVSIVRPFHTYGPGVALDDGRVFADFVSDIVFGRDIVMRSEGTAVRAFCYVADAIEGFFTVLLKGASGAAYNIGNQNAALSIAELAELLVGLFPEKRLKVVKDETPREASYAVSPVAKNIPAIDKARALGWEPRVGPREGFLRMVTSYQ
ncbi:MAG: NAD-dependent epimerase/dehydratase family protein [Blastomonas sp.]|uniref:NAD-dependent epimerase/dehydratase family protein n=1 Tax=Blastomonas sp. TaxID=1909299 RepID=UPI00406A5CD0|nr:NAD-dependent epimerase/dehydratase family protein [Blastomonas sp.]